MDISTLSRKEVGALGERVAHAYLKGKGFRLWEKNVARKTGELDLVVEKGNTLHAVEVKTIVVDAFPSSTEQDAYDPSVNIHEAKLRRIARTLEWYMGEKEWEGECSIDACLVWLRRHDGMAHVRYLPQIM